MDVQKCLVSIIVPVYNVEERLNLCINSLLCQTLKEIEIILVNDGSTDNSGTICEKYALFDKRIKVIQLENGGPARARNYGLKIATGEYIGFVDSDDYIDCSMFEKLYQLAEKRRSDISMCSYYIDKQGIIEPIVLEYCSWCSTAEMVKKDILQCYYSNNHKGLYSLCNKIFRRELLVNNGIVLDEHLTRAEDAWFVFECLKVAKSFSFVDECLYYYLQNVTSIMHTVGEDQYEKWVENRKKLLAENEFFGFLIDYEKFYEKFLYDVAVYCRDLMALGKKKKVQFIIQDDFMKETVKYCRLLPLHIKVLHKLVKLRFYKTAVLAYKIWSLKDAK